MQGEILQAFRSSRQKTVNAREEGTLASFAEGDLESRQDVAAVCKGTHEFSPNGDPGPAASTSRDIAISYLRLANLDNELIDRLSRYEASLWRQVVQTLFTLQALKRRGGLNR
jgi:hypothetical protein